MVSTAKKRSLWKVNFHEKRVDNFAPSTPIFLITAMYIPSEVNGNHRSHSQAGPEGDRTGIHVKSKKHALGEVAIFLHQMFSR